MLNVTAYAALSIALGFAVCSAVGPVTARPVRGGGRQSGIIYTGMMGSGMMGSGMMGPGMMQAPTEAPRGTANSGAAEFQRQCAMCHALQAHAPSPVGPNLHGLFGRKAGSMPGFAYSAAMRNSNVVWNDKTLDKFIASPHTFIAGDRMPFAGIADKRERENLIAYLKTATK